MRIAAIDIGSYSVRLTIAQVEGNDIKVLLEKGYITSLASGLREKGYMNEYRVKETLAILKEYRKEIDRLKVDKVVAVATEALRKAKNAKEFLKRVKEETEIEVRIITPEEEGELAFIATAFSLKPEGKFLVVDQGGGSTEFIFGEGFTIEEISSLPMGIVNLTERFLKSDPPAPEEIQNLMEFLQTHINPLKRDVKEVIGLGGTITTLASLDQNVYPYDPSRIHGYKLKKENIKIWLERLSLIPSEERSRLYRQIEDRRAQVIVAGIAMFLKILDIFDKEYLIVGDWGVKHGLIVKELTSKEGAKKAL